MIVVTDINDAPNAGMLRKARNDMDKKSGITIKCKCETEGFDEATEKVETLVDAFKRGELSEEDLSNWEKLIDKTVKMHVMEYVADEVVSKVRKLKEEGYYIGELINSLNKII